MNKRTTEPQSHAQIECEPHSGESRVMDRNATLSNLIAASIATIPGVILLFWFRHMDRASATIFDMLAYPLLFGTGLLALILLLNRYMCKESISSFNPAAGSLPLDIVHGLILFLVYVALTVLQQVTIVRWIPTEGPPPEIQELIRGLSEDPLLLAIWLGPVVWIGVALFEELHRTFFLKCLWSVWRTPVGRWSIACGSAALSGAIHSYQGPIGVISTTIMGFIAALYYLKRGRIWPLVIAHALYDSGWIIFGVAMSTG